MMWNWVPWGHWLWMAGAWIVAIAMIVWAVTALFPDQPRRDPHQILDERFARGEVDVEEYRRRCDELSPHTRPAGTTGA